MNNPDSSRISGKNLNYFKAQASKLQKQLSQADLVINSELRTRLYQCGQQQILESPEKIKRKQVLNIIALEYGFDDWAALKGRIELESQLDFVTFFCRNGTGGFLNHWFTSYAEAKAYQQSHGGVLLPYKHQYFVATKSYLEKFGFEKGDADWRAIDYDWVNPASNSAKVTIIQKLVKRWS